MKLQDLVKGIDIKFVSGELDKEIQEIHYDSRKVTPGSLFVCISGFKNDGHNFIDQAINNGAVAILGERDIKTPDNISYIMTPNSRAAMSKIASNFYNRPSAEMRVIGVTGTNGKTTTTHLIQAILEEAGKKAAILGTLYAKIGDLQKELGHTTPEALEIEEFMSFCREKDSKYLVMEVSSHALDLFRVADIEFNVAVFTNLTQDHLDYHRDMESYKNAKLKLFEMIRAVDNNFCIINKDDKYAQEFIKAAGQNGLSYGIENEADVKATNLNISLKGSSFTVKYKDIIFDINIKLIGLFSVYNTLAAIAFALKEGISVEIIKSALEKVEGVAGRFEQVKCGQNFTVIVDYAHTPDGLENILNTAKQIAEKRLITVFGCGGDRDRTKRPLMGEVAAKYSDFCVVTSDNPRSEEPQAIIDDIIPGLQKVENSRYAIIIDRREAIRHAIYLAKEGDLVVIAGKGHETYQLVNDKVLDFDDRKVAAEFLKGKVTK